MSMSTSANMEIVPRSGPSFTDYLADFFELLYRRKGFVLENFQTPAHMRRLLEELSFNRVPLAVWQSLLAAALKIVEMSETIGNCARHLGAFFVDVLCWICNRLTKMGVLKVGLFLLAFEMNSLITFVVNLIYYVVEYFVDRFWTELSTFVQSRLIRAPYYHEFCRSVIV